MNFLTIILLSLALVAFAVAGLAIRIILKKGGKFPNTHVGGNKYLNRKGIYCAQTQDKIERAKVERKIDYKNVKIVNN